MLLKEDSDIRKRKKKTWRAAFTRDSGRAAYPAPSQSVPAEPAAGCSNTECESSHSGTPTEALCGATVKLIHQELASRLEPARRLQLARQGRQEGPAPLKIRKRR